jgi:hypothetical protein
VERLRKKMLILKMVSTVVTGNVPAVGTYSVTTVLAVVYLSVGIYLPDCVASYPRQQ